MKKLEKMRKEDIVEDLAHARENDVSEDTDELPAIYEEKAEIEERISKIQEILENSEIINKNGCSPYSIQIGSEVKIKCNGKTQTVTIVSSVESDPLKSLISNKSPLGKALLKAKVGDDVKVHVQGKDLIYTVLEVC
jgi:transcription elongation factor GreA